LRPFRDSFAVGNAAKVTQFVSPSITLSYDVLNRLTNMVDAAGTTVYGYDSVGELLSEDGPWPSDTVNYTYQNRLRTSLSVQTLNGPAWTQSYGYDLAPRLTATTSPAGTFNYVYDPVEVQRVDELTLPNGAYITNTFDSVARLTGTWLITSSGTNLDSYVYAYNPASQRTNVLRTAGDYVNYAYDAIGELASAIAYEPSNTIRADERLSYAYDAGGNLVQKKTSTTLASQVAYSLNGLNEITNGLQGTWSVSGGWSANIPVAGSTTSPATNVTVNGSSVSPYGDNTFARYENVNAGSNGFTVVAKDVYGRISTNMTSVNVVPTNNAYSYDLNGNLLTDGTRCFAYDDENELISVWKTNGWRNDFVYDGKMRRRIELDYTWNGSTWTQTNEILFVYDGNLVVQERNGNNQAQVTYTRGNDLSGTLQGAGGIGGLLARTDSAEVVPWIMPSGVGTPQFGTHSYYHADGNGNITMLIAASQMIVAKYLYDPFGNALAQYGLLANINKYCFSSKEWNANSGLYYYLYRFYDPNLQRWLNRDPIQELGGWNLYTFVENYCLNAIDSWGEDIGIFGGGTGNQNNPPRLGPPDSPLPPPSPMTSFSICVAMCLGEKVPSVIGIVASAPDNPIWAASKLGYSVKRVKACYNRCNNQIQPPPRPCWGFIGTPGQGTNGFQPGPVLPWHTGRPNNPWIH
jgi:RHS repeat-associated protein